MGRNKKIVTNVLDKRETQTIYLICKQYSNQEIADEMGLKLELLMAIGKAFSKKQNL